MKFKIEKNFNRIPYVYSLIRYIYRKIYNRIYNFGIQNKNSFDFVFSNCTARKQNGPISPEFSSSIINIIKNCDDLKKWLLATSDYGQELQEDLNAIVGYNEKFNNAIVRHALDTKNAGIMQNLNPLNATFCDVKKFDLQNPVLGKIATQVKASKFTDEQLTKKILMQDNIAKIKNRLEELKQPINFNDSDDETRSPGGGGGDDGAPPPLPPTSGRRSADSDAYGPLMRRLEELRHGLVPPGREAQQRDLRLAERKTELEGLADRGVVKKRRSEEGRFRPVLPDTPPPTLIRDDFWPPPPVQPSD